MVPFTSHLDYQVSSSSEPPSPISPQIHLSFDFYSLGYFQSTAKMSGRGGNDNNRANQCNPNHTKSGPGHASGYKGTGSKSDLNNHANQKNPNNKAYGGGSQSGWNKSSGKK